MKGEFKKTKRAIDVHKLSIFIFSMATAVEDAAVVTCFMTSKYQSNHFWQRELKYAADQCKPIIPCLMTLDWNQNDCLGLITAGLIWLDFRDVSNVNLDKKIQRLTSFFSFSI